MENFFGQRNLFYGLSALQKDLLGGVTNNLSSQKLREYLERKVERTKQFGKSILEQKIRDSIASNQTLQKLANTQRQIREIANNPTGVPDRYIEKGQQLALSDINNRIDRVTTTINDSVNQKYSLNNLFFKSYNLHKQFISNLKSYEELKYKAKTKE